MMQASTFRSEERVGLAVAFGLHVLLVVVLLVQPDHTPVARPEERMTVNLASDVSMAATAPDPVSESRAAEAPTLSDTPSAPAEAEAEAEPTPAEPVVRPVARPIERVQTPAPAPAARPVARPRPAPARTPTPTPARTQPRAQPAPAPARARPAPAPARAAPRPAPARPAAASGGSRLGDDFLEGAGASTRTTETRVPASQIGASTQASLIQSIIRQIRPHWSAPQGVDAELLVTQLSFRLNPDGSLNGRPRVVSQSGVTDSNRPQQELHAERAIRAVQLAAPFDLPDEYYNAWRTIDGARFDRNLAR